MKNDITVQELKAILKAQGVKVRPSYHHDDYLFTSFTMPFPLKNKLDRMCKKYEITRSKLVQMLISHVDEKNLFEYLEKI